MARLRDGDMPEADDAPGAGSVACDACKADDPQVRYTHYLTLARQMDFDAIEAHLWQSARTRKRFDAEVAREHIHGVMAWVKDQVSGYSNIVDAQTGAKLPWWEGRRQTLLAVRVATEQQAKKRDAQQHAREMGLRPRHAALTPMSDTLKGWRAPWEKQTPMREPGEEG